LSVKQIVHQENIIAVTTQVFGADTTEAATRTVRDLVTVETRQTNVIVIAPLDKMFVMTTMVGLAVACLAMHIKLFSHPPALSLATKHVRVIV
jgi:hypothetical protein